MERHHYSLGVDNPEAPLSAKRGRLQVPNQVTTLPDHGGCSQTPPDKTIALTCRNTTQRDAAGRNSQAWHARGQGFESPKLHAFSCTCSKRK